MAMANKQEPMDWRTMPLSSPLPWDVADTPPTDQPADEALAGHVLPPDAFPQGVGGTCVVQTTDEEPEGGLAQWPRLCCVVGPCRHYAEIAQVSGVVSGVEHRTLYRYCRLLTEEGGTMSLRELTIRWCSSYSPPVLSMDGWRHRARMSGLGARSMRKALGTLPIMLRMSRRLAQSLGYPEVPGKQLDEIVEPDGNEASGTKGDK